MPKKVAIIEDEAELASLLEYNLSRQGLATRVISGSKGAVEQLESWKPDLIILDVMLPDGDGFDLCRRLRKVAGLARIPVLFLTARSDEVDRVLGLEIGGDDYVTKPFSPRELVARVNVILRRAISRRLEKESSRALAEGRLSVDPEQHVAAFAGIPLRLTAIEFGILRAFLARPAAVFSRE